MLVAQTRSERTRVYDAAIPCRLSLQPRRKKKKRSAPPLSCGSARRYRCRSAGVASLTFAWELTVGLAEGTCVRLFDGDSRPPSPSSSSSSTGPSFLHPHTQQDTRVAKTKAIAATTTVASTLGSVLLLLLPLLLLLSLMPVSPYVQTEQKTKLTGGGGEGGSVRRATREKKTAFICCSGL